MEIVANGVNDAFDELGHWLALAGIEENSRNGRVIVAPETCTITYMRPTERVLFSPLRDANPLFHIFEAVWMMAGRNDIEFPARFNKRFTEYSDDGRTQPGAYGYRWRKYFDYDQLFCLVEELKRHPDTRRAVLAMWDGGGSYLENRPGDLERIHDGTKDAPCNTHVYFDCRGGHLNMTVCNRSNDFIWGLFGANVVHFSILQEWLSYAIKIPIGKFTTFSNNVHFYPQNIGGGKERLYELAVDAGIHNYYKEGVDPLPLVKLSAENWLREAEMFCEDPLGAHTYTEPFFVEIAAPLYLTWHLRKGKDPTWVNALNFVAPSDWKMAATEWIERREAARSKVG